MSDGWLRTCHLCGTVDLEPHLSLVETAERLSLALSLRFTEEMTGRYEEYPAYVAEGAGFEFALLGTPLIEHDIRERESPNHQLMISSSSDGGGQPGRSVEISAFFARLIQARTGLICVALEFPATA
jgi:hypothetical protein